MEALVTSVTRLAERLDAVDAARSQPTTGAFASTSSSRPAVIQETAGADEEFSFMPRAPVTTSTTDLKQLSLPRRLLDGRVELGSELTHRMLRNRALVERRLTRQAPYEEF